MSDKIEYTIKTMFIPYLWQLYFHITSLFYYKERKIETRIIPPCTSRDEKWVTKREMSGKIEYTIKTMFTLYFMASLLLYLLFISL